MKRHKRRNHLNKDTTFESEELKNLVYFGTVKKEAKEPVPIVGAIKEKIVPHTRLKINNYKCLYTDIGQEETKS